MKVHVALAIAYTSLAHGATVSMKTMGASFGPKNCVMLTHSSAGSCVISTDCEGADLSETEFAFDCVQKDGIVRHSFGTGGFDSREEFDTEVKCDRCEKPSPAEVVEKPVAKRHTEKAAPAPKHAKKAAAKLPQHPAAVNFKARSQRRSGKGGNDLAVSDQARRKEEPLEEVAEELEDVLDPESNDKKKPEATRYGPGGCVSTWKSQENHCIMRTDCKKHDISRYEFGLVCVDKVGSPVKHLFGKDSFDKEETFDTLIKCDRCLGLEDIPDSVALNGEVTTMGNDIANLKDVMKNISINVEMLNKEVFKNQNSAPGPAPSSGPSPSTAPAPAAAVLVHHTTAHRRTQGKKVETKTNLRHSHAKHHAHRKDDDDEDGDDYDDEEVSDSRSEDVPDAVLRDDEDDREDEE